MTRAGYNTGWYWRQWSREVAGTRAALVAKRIADAAEGLGRCETLAGQLELEFGDIRTEQDQVRYEVTGATADPDWEPPAPATGAGH